MQHEPCNHLNNASEGRVQYIRLGIPVLKSPKKAQPKKVSKKGVSHEVWTRKRSLSPPFWVIYGTLPLLTMEHFEFCTYYILTFPANVP